MNVGIVSSHRVKDSTDTVGGSPRAGVTNGIHGKIEG